MNAATAQQVIARARAAQSSWASVSVRERCGRLAELSRELARQCEAVATVIARETGKPFLDALSGDVLVTLEHLRYCRAEARRALCTKRIRRSPLFFAGTRFEEHREPYGVVLIYAPSNYPLQLSLVPATTALAAGNAVVLKCSERTPETAALIAGLCATAGIPKDLLQVLSDEPETAAALLDAGPDFLFFTGSSANGQQLAKQAAEHLIPAMFELGGKDPAVVFADCNLERAVEGVVYGAFCNAGRVCVGIRRVYVEAPIYKAFMEALTRRMAQLRIGWNEDSDLCPLPVPSQAQPRMQLQDALSRGARLVWPPDSFYAGGQPTLVEDVPSAAMLLSEESFGPILCAAPFRDEDEAVALANASPFALGSSIWTGDRARARRVAARLAAGSCAVNDVIRNVGNPWAAFGGNRRSGYGRYRGTEGFRAFTRVKTVMLARQGRPREMHWFPLQSTTARRLAWLLRLRHGGGSLLTRAGRMLRPLLFGLVVAAGVTGTVTAETHLNIEVRLAPRAHGELGYLIFATAAGFPGDVRKAVRRGFVPIGKGAEDVTIDTALPPGTYAVSVYEDLNGNHRLDHNFLGIPREPVGASGNPRQRLGPPHFKECSFQLGDKVQTIRIVMVGG